MTTTAANTQYILNVNGNVLSISPNLDARIRQVGSALDSAAVTIQARSAVAALQLASEYRAWGAKVTHEVGDTWLTVAPR